MTQYRPKSSSWLMRLAGRLAKPFMPDFMTRVWTTLGATVYYPANVVDPASPCWDGVRQHEDVHVEQHRRWGYTVTFLLYYVLPLPILLSGRWFVERDAYMVDIRRGAPIHMVVWALWGHYGWPWPRSWMTSWFKTRCQRDGIPHFE